MTIPMELQRAEKEFERFLALARDNAGLATRNQTFAITQGALFAFRDCLNVKDAHRFASALPALLRAIFIMEWDVEQPRKPFGDRETMTKNAQFWRRDHNFAPDSCITDVAIALRQCVDVQAFDKMLNDLGEEAKAFWTVSD